MTLFEAPLKKIGKRRQPPSFQQGNNRQEGPWTPAFAESHAAAVAALDQRFLEGLGREMQALADKLPSGARFSSPSPKREGEGLSPLGCGLLLLGSGVAGVGAGFFTIEFAKNESIAAALEASWFWLAPGAAILGLFLAYALKKR